MNKNHNHNFKNLTGRKINRLDVIRLDHIKNNAYWLCKCVCGNIKVIAGGKLLNGHTKSCGCLKRERCRFKIGHPEYRTPEILKLMGEKMKGRKITWGDKISKALKGKIVSEETRHRISLVQIGRVPWNKGLKGFRAGKQHHNWKGGITPENVMIRSSLEYRLWREAVFTRDDWTCLECGIRGKELHAHHIKPFSLFPELRLAIDNGATLCVECHKMTYSGRNKKINNTIYA